MNPDHAMNPDQLEDIAGRLALVDQRIGEAKALLKEYEEQRARLLSQVADLPPGTHQARAYAVQVRETRRWSEDVARQVLNDNTFAAICETKPSSSLARNILPPALYQQCQAVVGRQVSVMFGPADGEA